MNICWYEQVVVYFFSYLNGNTSLHSLCFFESLYLDVLSRYIAELVDTWL